MFFHSDARLSKFAFYFFKLSGVNTMSLQRVPDKRKIDRFIYGYSILGMAYNALVVVATSLLYYSASYGEFQPLQEMEFDMKEEIVQLRVRFVTVFCVLLAGCAKQRQLVRVGNETRRLHESLLAFDPSMSDGGHDFRRIVLTTILLPCGLILSVMAHFAISSIPAGSGMVCYHLYYFWRELIILCLFVQYSSILGSIEASLRVANANLAKILRPTIEIVDDSAAKMQTMRLSQLRKLYSSLRDVSEEFADFYSPSMFLSVGYILLSLTDHTYFAIMTLLYHSESFTLRFILHCATIVFCSCFSLIALTRSVDGVVSESHRTGKIITEWEGNWQNRSIPVAQGIHFQVIQFSNYLMHQPFEFKVAGIFSLDGSLLLSISSAVTTYTMILLQLRNSRN